MPKRKLDEGNPDALHDSLIASETDESDNSNSNSSIHTNSSTDVPSSDHKGPFSHREKRPKKSVQFKGVRVFYFPRKQGFVCVPSQGGSTLGMGEAHMCAEDFTLKAYQREQRAIRKQILLEQKQQGKLAHVKINTKPKTASSNRIDDNNGNSDSAESSESDLDVDDYFFLQPISTRQRRLLLRSSGVKKIDTTEKEECRNIRLSRESCGCDCRVFCDPETCACSQAGIKCQVDRLSFPCGCSKDGCGNVNGRIEFNPVRVRTHFIHTLMRLELDHKKEEHLNTQRLALKQTNTSQNDSGTIDLQQPLDNFTTVYRNSDINDNPKDTQLNMSEYNSNELGSCRDCQNTEIADVLMQEAQLGNGGMDVDMCIPNPDLGTMSSYSKDKQNSYNHVPDVSSKNDSLPCVMLFNDDNDYSAEDTTAFTTFKQEESSYSESSDCSSELSEDGQNFRHFQELSSFTGSGVSNFADGILGSGGYCGISTHGEFQRVMTPTTSISKSQPEQKYIDLSSATSSYKLEPISEILNPIRYQDYQSHSVSNMSARMWSNNAEHYSATYLDAHSNQSNGADIFKCSGPNSQQSPSYNSYNTNSSVISRDINSNGNHDNQLTNLDSVQTQMTSCVSRDGHYPAAISQLKERSSTVESNSFAHLSKPSPESIYSDFSVSDLHNGMTEYVPATASTATTTTTTDISNSFNGTGNLCTQLASSEPEDGINGVVPLLESSSSGSQNFGEIIKESIVETVSA